MKEKILNNFSLKLLSCAVAFIVWVIVVNYDNPNTTRTISNIPIELKGVETLQENNQVYTITGSDTATIRVRCPRKLAQSLKSTDFEATADFSLMYSQTNRVPVSVTSTNSSVTSDMITLVTQSLEVEFEDIVNRQMDVVVQSSGDPAEGYQVGEMTPSPAVVTLTAPQSLLDQVASIGVVVDVESVSQSFSQIESLKFYNAGGREISNEDLVNLTVSYSDITVAVEILNVKNVSIDTTVTGQEEVARGYRFSGIQIDPATVKISGRRSVLAEVTSLSLPEGELDVTGASETIEKTFQLSDLILPEGVSLADPAETEIHIEMVIEQLDTKTYTMDLSRLQIEGLSSRLEITNEDATVEVAVEGLSSDLNALDLSEISGELDLTGLKAGTHNVPVGITVPQGFDVVGDPAIRLQLGLRETSTAADTESEEEAASFSPTSDSGEGTSPTSDTGE